MNRIKYEISEYFDNIKNQIDICAEEFLIDSSLPYSSEIVKKSRAILLSELNEILRDALTNFTQATDENSNKKEWLKNMFCYFFSFQFKFEDIQFQETDTIGVLIKTIEPTSKEAFNLLK